MIPYDRLLMSIKFRVSQRFLFYDSHRRKISLSPGLSSSFINSCSLKRSQARSTSWRLSSPARPRRTHQPVLSSTVRTITAPLSAGDGGRHPQTSGKNSSSLHNRIVQSQIQNRTLTADFLVQTAQIRTPPRLSPLARIVMTGAGQDSYHSIRALALHSPPAGLLQPVARSSGVCETASWMMD
ncbi:hypothetical protein BJY00DRAFT_143863 [Aspergillus carlsbadensis]|nr:hypothetical protein BJY00DRAFT_143863 [Aspergillus carlsbadensis]